MRLGVSLLLAATAWQPVAAGVVDKFASTSHASCHVLPGDASWPSANTWRNFNASVDGRLVATAPLGAPCHDPNFDQDACTALQKQWMLPQTHLPSSSSVMQPFFANQSCDPFTPREWPCTLGNYVSYAVNVSTAAHVATAIKFARQKNLRVVIRNTGHDYFGRSTGAGGLAIWVHGLQQAEVLQWADTTYTGPAFKGGAGILGADVIEAVNPHGLVVLTGECPTVGLAGGYTQGGGHSALSTTFGLAADQVLEYDVVTANGTSLKASPNCNSDLYWALSGGGGGTFGVVTSITVRAYPAGNIGGGKLALSLQYTNQTNFDKAVSAFHALLPGMIDHGASVSYIVTSQAFLISSATVFNSTGDFARDTVLAPFLKVLQDLAIPSQSSFTTLPYRDHYDTYMGPLPYGHLGVEGYQYGGRLIPRSVVENSNDALQETIRNVTSQGLFFVNTASAWTAPADSPANAVFPPWRDTLIQAQLISLWDPKNWDKMLADQQRITNEIMPQLEAITPGSGAYLNEADFQQPHWKETFYGSNYDRLLSIKNTWDPQGIFYGLKTVGSDAWTVDEHGRMCRA